MTQRLTRVFVYGTLRAGERNHHLLGARSRVASVRTEAMFELFDLGTFPAMTPNGTTAVVGEVYDVDEDTLAALDALEEHPGFYQRQTIRLEDGEDVLAYLLSMPRLRAFAGDRHTRIPSGDWVGARTADHREK